MTFETLKPIFDGLYRNILNYPMDEIYYSCNPLRILIQSPGWSHDRIGRSRIYRSERYLLACNIPYESISVAGFSSESITLKKYEYKQPKHE